MWLLSEAIGGKVALPGEDAGWLDAASATGSISQLSSALKAATESRRCFRNLNQWTPGAFQYGTAAIPTGQLDLVGFCGIVVTTHRIAEVKRPQCVNSNILAVLYDEHRRRDWNRRSERADPSLNVSKEAWEIDKDILDAVEAKPNTTLAAAGIASRPSASAGPTAGSSSTRGSTRRSGSTRICASSARPSRRGAWRVARRAPR